MKKLLILYSLDYNVYVKWYFPTLICEYDKSAINTNNKW